MDLRNSRSAFRNVRDIAYDRWIILKIRSLFRIITLNQVIMSSESFKRTKSLVSINRILACTSYCVASLRVDVDVDYMITPDKSLSGDESLRVLIRSTVGAGLNIRARYGLSSSFKELATDNTRTDYQHWRSMLSGRKEATQGQNLEARRAACPRRKDPEISIAAGSLEQHDPMRSGSLDRAFSGLEIITSPPPSVSCRRSQATLALVPLMTRSVTLSGMPPQWRRRRRRRRRGGGSLRLAFLSLPERAEMRRADFGPLMRSICLCFARSTLGT